jgi:hypothetical protein
LNNAAPRTMVRPLLWDIALNATIPAALYLFAKHFISPSELSALLWAATFPLLKSAYDLTKRHALDPVALLILLGLVTSIVAVLFGGTARLLLIRESLFTGAFGLACLASLLFPRPIMFYFGRYFMAGRDAQKRETFNARWRNPIARRAHRLVTATWGFVYVGEFVLRVVLVYNLPAAIVLAVAPFLTGLATVGAIVWTFWYAYRVRDRMDALAKTGTA